VIDPVRAELREHEAGALALQLVRSAGDQFGWPDAWLSRLRRLRTHSVDDVATLALHVWTTSE
jgi:hypothetical protein